jgi:putative nucleotidyltransferase with HDIG domain
MSDYAKYLKNMPVIPDIASKILTVTEEKVDISFRELENTIKMDPGLSAKILKAANSAMYARQREVTNLQTAITLLGFKTIKSLVLLITASNMFSKSQHTTFYKFFWKHSIINAFLARSLAEKTGARQIEDQCFLSGLLHDIGQVALHNANPEGYAQVLELAKKQRKRISEIEESLFGSNHREVGASVLRNWSFPGVYVDSAAEHGSPNITSPHKQTILIVSIADFITSNIDLYSDEPLGLEIFRDVIRQTTLSEKELVEYQENFLDTLTGDKLFQECKSLFNLN